MKKGIIILLIAIFVTELLGTAFCQSEDEALRLYQKGQEAYKYGRYNEALSYFERSLKIIRQLNNKVGISANLNNIGEVYRSLGQYDKALFYHEEALKIKRELNIPQDIAISLYNIGTVYSSINQYDKALTYYKEALKIFRELKIPRYIATNLNNIGKVCDSLGQYDKALSYYEEALKVDRELNAPQGIATSLNNIGTVYKSLGQYDKALSYYEEALRICRELNIPRDIATSLSNIGFVYLFQKRYKDAENKFIESKKEREKTGGIEWKGEPGLVDVYLATDRYEEALKLLEKMGPEWNAHDPYRIQFHTQNGLALKGIGLLKEASQEFLKAVSISEGMRQKVKEKAGFFGAGYGGGRIRSYRGLFVTLSERAIKGEKIDDEFILYGKDLVSNAFYFSEATKARALLEAMAESAKRYARTELPSEIREKEEDILNQLSAIENRWDETYKKGETAFKELLERKEKLKKELDTFISKTRKEYPIYAALHYPKPIPPEELPLKDDEVLLEYAIGDNTIYLFIVRKGGVKNLIKIPTSRETLEEKVMAFMEPLNTGQYHKFSVKIAKELYDILLSEAVKEIKETEKIIIVPDGILGLLPFEALMIKPEEDYKDSLYVGDRCSITYAQSATTLALTRMLKPSQTEKPLFALGNPIYNKEDPRYVAYKQGKTEQTLFAMDSERYVYRGITIIPKQDKTDKEKINWEEVVYSPLPETEDEVRAIAKTFNLEPKPPDVLLNIYANETNLRNVFLKDYRYLHFATHADLPGKVQGIKEPFLLLGQVENRGEDDGFLTSTEVLELRLDANMVVLSACLTGRGRVMEGEGVVNFARAFQYAGARSVLVSLWEVASKETVEYMKLFYQYLKDGRSKSEALTFARKEIKKKYPNPFYWAPFILHGER